MSPALSFADETISELYKSYGIEGAIIIESLDGRTQYIHNKQRAERPYIPASTFKVPNTLIALEEGVIKDDKEIIKWDGKDKGMEPWNKDQTLATAFAVSCVWCYQEFAKKIGNETYLKYLSAMAYGNEKMGGDLTTFWLGAGDLLISVEEQVDFLRKLVNEALPFSQRSIHLLKKVMLVEETAEYSIRAKTGWAGRIEPEHGWYIGYVEVENKVWLFANNIEIRKKEDGALRKKLVMEALKLKGIL